MANTKFKSGQLVDYYPARAMVAASLREYKVLRSLPRDRGEQEYRIKSVAELFERVAKESELAKR